jgi:putative membrane protein
MLIHFLKGFCMGAADVVPGVSGGTMAFILGIYERLLAAIRSVDLTWLGLLRQRRFADALRRLDLQLLLPLMLGIAAALAFFTRVVPLPALIRSDPELVYGLFFGLILASIPVLLLSLRPTSATQWLWILPGCVVGLLVVNLVPTNTPETSWFVFLCGTIAISAMLLPGISGSFILLLLQKYAYVFDAIGRLDLAVVAPFAGGCVLGLILFSRAIGWFLSRFPVPTMMVITGILMASLWKVWPFQERVFAMVRGKQRLLESQPVLPQALDASSLGALAMMAAGVAAVLAIDLVARRRRRQEG